MSGRKRITWTASAVPSGICSESRSLCSCIYTCSFLRSGVKYPLLFTHCLVNEKLRQWVVGAPSSCCGRRVQAHFPAYSLCSGPAFLGESCSDRHSQQSVRVVGVGTCSSWRWQHGFAGDYQSHVPEPQDDLTYSWGQPGLGKV